MPHILICGPSGSGKKTIIKFLLCTLYDKNVENLTKTKYKVTGSSNKADDIYIMQSPYHIVIEPNNNNYDKYIIQDIVKEYAKHISINMFETKNIFKTILINNAHNLSYHAQTSLRRTMEIYASTCRFILIGNNLSKIIEPLHWRCSVICVPSPTNWEIWKTIFNISALENINISIDKINQIVRKSDRNIKKAIWQLSLIQYELDISISLDETIEAIVDDILTINGKNMFAKILQIRENMYNLMVTNITCTDIIKEIVNLLFDKSGDDQFKLHIIRSAAEAEHRLIVGRRGIKHLEFFITSVAKYIIIINPSTAILPVAKKSIKINN
jgi:replication factor C subunit 3/5